jgi:hypothetical protein
LQEQALNLPNQAYETQSSTGPPANIFHILALTPADSKLIVAFLEIGNNAKVLAPWTTAFRMLAPFHIFMSNSKKMLHAVMTDHEVAFSADDDRTFGTTFGANEALQAGFFVHNSPLSKTVHTCRALETCSRRLSHSCTINLG